MRGSLQSASKLFAAPLAFSDDIRYNMCIQYPQSAISGFSFRVTQRPEAFAFGRFFYFRKIEIRGPVGYKAHEQIAHAFFYI